MNHLAPRAPRAGPAAFARRGPLVAGLAAVVLVGSLVALVRQVRGPARPRISTTEWYYDLNTRQLFAAPLGQLPPIAAPSGPLPDGTPAGVRAYVYSCGDCSAAQQSIAYLETYTPAARDRLQRLRAVQFGMEPPGPDSGIVAGPEDGLLLAGQGSLVRRPDDDAWLGRSHPDGQSLIASTLPRCPPGTFARPCAP